MIEMNSTLLRTLAASYDADGRIEGLLILRSSGFPACPACRQVEWKKNKGAPAAENQIDVGGGQGLLVGVGGCVLSAVLLEHH
jgi:hypothetical protein